jgi:hypothetical protein
MRIKKPQTLARFYLLGAGLLGLLGADFGFELPGFLSAIKMSMKRLFVQFN